MGKKCNTNCCVFGCNSKKGVNPSLHFHHFPKLGENKVGVENKFGVVESVDRRFAWEKVLQMGKQKPVTKNMLVCSRHFQISDYILFGFSTTSPRLKKNSVPSMNLPKKSTTKKDDHIDGKQHERVGKRQLLRDRNSSLKSGLDHTENDNGNYNYAVASSHPNSPVPVQFAHLSNKEQIAIDGILCLSKVKTENFS